MVRRAQQWVNATYSGAQRLHAGAGRRSPGAATMYALTRALQHELGITELSDSFGPTTLSLLPSGAG